MKVIKDQPLCSTLEDSQGERRDKQFLEELIEKAPPRFPLGQHHDNALKSVGYIENFRIAALSDVPGQWQIIGDVYIEDDKNFSDFGGFSFSTTEIEREAQEPLAALYVPFPFYRNKDVIDEIVGYSSHLSAGRWVKKNSDPSQINLLVSFILFVLAPVWKKIFDEKVWPVIEEVLESYRKGRFKDTPFDYGAVVKGKLGENVNLLFVPDRKNIEMSFTKDLIKQGLEKVMNLIVSDEQGAKIGISLIKLHFHDYEEGYKISSVQYCNGDLKYLI
jgi:hypothetical protein